MGCVFEGEWVGGWVDEWMDGASRQVQHRRSNTKGYIRRVARES